VFLKNFSKVLSRVWLQAMLVSHRLRIQDLSRVENVKDILIFFYVFSQGFIFLLTFEDKNG